MAWEHPQLLHALWLLPLLAVLLLRAHALRRRDARRFAGPWLVGRLVPRPSRALAAAKGLALLCGLALLVVALARPRFGETFEEVRARGIDMVILLDVSRSMLAEDVAPNRLRRATSDIRDLLPKLQGDRVALVAFAGAAVVRAPLTTDQAFIRQMLDSLDADAVTRGGSTLGDAIRKALEVLPEAQERDQAILLLTDGEDHESFPREAARAAAERGVKLFVVGLGDPRQGARIPQRDAQGNLGYLQHEGREVWSRVDRELLTDLALATGGAYVPAHTSAYDLGQLYDDHLRQLTRGELHGGRQRLLRDQFPLFLWLGLALLLLETLLPTYLRGQVEKEENRMPRPVNAMVPRRSTTTGATPPNSPRPRAAGARGAALPARLIAAGVCLVLPATAWAQSAAERAREGVRQFEREEFLLAERSFTLAQEAEPENKRHAFNRACAVAAQGRLADALPWFREAAGSGDTALAARAHFNVGGVLAAQAAELAGDQPAAVPQERRSQLETLCEQAVAAYRRSMAQAPSEEGRAAEQLERVRTWLNQVRQLWQEEARRQQRQQDLLAYLEALQEELAEGRRKLLPLVDTWPSPRRRQVAYEQAEAARRLHAEMDHLEGRFLQAIPSGPQPADDPTGLFHDSNPNDSEVREWVRDQLGGCRDALSEAAQALDAGQLAPALAAHHAADDRLNDLFLAACPFETLLRKAIERQEQLVELSRAPDGAPADRSDPSSPAAPLEPARSQRRITLWSQALREKALGQLSRLPADAGDLPPDSSAEEEPQAAPAEEPENREERERNAAQPKSAQAPLPDSAKAWEAAVRLTPEIEQLSQRAAGDLERREFEQALPRQERILELLREIARSQAPPDQPPQSDDQQSEDPQQPGDDQQSRDDRQRQNDPQSQEPQSQDQQSQDQQSQDQQPESRQPQGQKPQDQKPQDQKPQDQQSQDQQSESRQPQDQKPQDQTSQGQKSQGQKSQDASARDEPSGRSPSERGPRDEDERQREVEEPRREDESSPQEGLDADSRRNDREDDGSEGDPQSAEEAPQVAERAEREAALRQARQTEAILRQARERQQRYAELLRQLRARMRGSARVEKDW